eukprot:TRINITY_DN35215_c3_g1_i1.p1 TRINITY_DN35215_c3_g1~~TRINITY_DN35215_c3_g1_i1.p1  ORF type:complete len:103 (+),score=5.27 TRINITY_DN35215_c3_g1_i1:1024-1332(+)
MESCSNYENFIHSNLQLDLSYTVSDIQHFQFHHCKTKNNVIQWPTSKFQIQQNPRITFSIQLVSPIERLGSTSVHICSSLILKNILGKNKGKFQVSLVINCA